ncbi:MAG: hypothetical protein D6782_01010 [Alphaproteobacteria bacterium]|nr:MAG: hypothetical protein D6782_01010 [Alphaproteobacteria bacterium]
MALSRSHGITRDAADFHDPDQGDWYYEQHSLGFNYRMTELQAALGISQLARLDAFLARRRALAARYDRLLADLPVIRPRCLPQADSAWHLYAITLRDPAWRRPVFDSLRAAGIGVQIHYIPVHLQPYFQAMGFRRGDFPQAESYYARTLSLPLFPDLSETQQDRVVACLRQALSEAGA